MSMNHVLGAYGGLLVPGAVALVLLFLVIKVVNAIAKLVAALVLIAVLAGGYLAYGRLAAIDKAATAATYQGRAGLTSAAALAHDVGIPARRALATAGLDPAYVRIHVICGQNTEVQLRYADEHYMFGLLSHQWFTVPMQSSAHC